MRAILLAAGRGSRLGSLTAEVPKCMVSLAGRTLLSRQIEVIRQSGIDMIGIVRGYKAEQIEVPGAVYFHNEEWSSTNMLVSLMQANSWLKEERCFVSYSDIVYGVDAIEALQNTEEPIIIPYNVNWLPLWQARFVDPLSDAETFRVDSYGYVTEIGGKPSSVEEIQGQYMGLLMLSPEGWRTIEHLTGKLDKADVRRMDMTGLISALVNNGVPVRAIPYEGPWLEVDSESDLRLYEQHYSHVL
nr:phosphocholine cytidylyltransferase family protein [Paenibacillus curdlanolyticus]